jgi:pimeloyl-ACP methyl ester carboxylesterase
MFLTPNRIILAGTISGDHMKKLRVLALLLVSVAVYAKTEIGELQGVPFRIDVPENWNHNLVVYYHGYGTEPVKFKAGEINPVLAEFTKRGYAVVQSAYSKPGWAVEQAIPETEALRKYFLQNYGAPKETFDAGHSMGGFLTVETIEMSPETYVAGLDLCGAVASPPDLTKPAFDFGVVFDYYFPGLLPPVDKVPADYQPTKAKIKELEQQLKDHPAQAAAMRQYAKLKSDREVANDAAFLAYVLMDLQQRSSGNPFSNRDTIYNGTPDDNAVNDGVKRYDATARLTYLSNHFTLTGKLQRPILAIHTTYDPLVPVEIPNRYAFLTEKNGSGDMFVQQYVEHDGHCNITPAEVGKGFDELLAWAHERVRPHGGHLAVGGETGK